MPKFVKKPVVVEAIEWFPGVVVAGVLGWNETDQEIQLTSCNNLLFSVPPGLGWMDTLEGSHLVTPGDWIITGVKGEQYACKPDVFEQTYQLVEE